MPALGIGTRPIWRRALASAVAVSALASGAVAIAPAPAQAGAGARGETPTSDITMIQANIYTGLTVPRFQADVRKVLALEPDFVTYNEVPFRSDSVIAPAGYDLYRDMTNRFTAATPVAWRADRWTAIDQGRYLISNWRGRPPGRQVELGRRYANWVTLQGTDGRVLSVVSIHVAPVVRGMPDLLRRSVARLGLLVDRLAPSGPVLVGGDFNVHYKSGRYPRDLLDAHGMVPTYDSMGAYFATGDHHGATIDYVFDRGTDVLAPDNQYPVELRSDHDAVVAGLSWVSDPESWVVANNPRGNAADQRASLTSIVAGIRSAEPGSIVKLATYGLDLPAVVRQVKRAVYRGVQVRISTAGERVTSREQRLSRFFAARPDSGSWLHRCGTSCRTRWQAVGISKTFMMVSDPAGGWKIRYDANRNLGPAIIARASRVRVSTGSVALRDGRERLRVVR